MGQRIYTGVAAYLSLPIVSLKAAQPDLGVPLLSIKPKWFSWSGNDFQAVSA